LIELNETSLFHTQGRPYIQEEVYKEIYTLPQQLLLYKLVYYVKFCFYIVLKCNIENRL